MWISLFITSGLALWCVEETGGLGGKRRRSGLPLLVVNTEKLLQLWHMLYERKRTGKRGTEVGGENEKRSVRTHTESQYDSGKAGKGPDRTGYRDR